MKLTALSQELLNAALATVSPAAGGMTHYPILQCIHFAAEERCLTLTASAGDFSIRRTVAVEGATPGTAVVPADALTGIVGRLPKGRMLTLTQEGNSLHLDTGSGKYEIAGPAADEYPSIDFDVKPLLTVPAAALKRGIATTVFAADKPGGRGSVHYSNGVCLAIQEGRLDFVATNGNLLALRRLDGVRGIAQEDSLLIPMEMAAEIGRLLPDDEDTPVEICADAGRAVLRLPTLLISCALYDIKFPPYQNVLPKTTEGAVRMNRADLVDCLVRLDFLQREKWAKPHVAFSIEDESVVVLTAGQTQRGAAEERLAGQLFKETFSVYFETPLLLSALKNAQGENIELRRHGGDRSNTFSITSPTDPDWLAVLMPFMPA